MTAQTNDPLTSFAYPQSTNNSATTPVVPSDPPTPMDQSQTVNTPLEPAMDPSSVRGNVIEGPAPVVPDQSILEPMPEGMDVSSTPAPTPDPLPVSMPTPSDDTSTVMPTSDPATQPTDDKKADEPEEEHDSPLKALAKKLSKLREEFVQDVPEEEKKEETSMASTVSPDATKLDEAVVPTDSTPAVDQNIPDMPVPQDVTASVPTSMPDPSAMTTSTPLTNPLPDLPKEDVLPPVTEVDPATQGIVVEEKPAQDSTPAIPLPTDTTSQAISSDLGPAAPANPTSTLEQMFPEVVDKPKTDEVQSEAPVDTAASATLPTPNSSPSFVIDENDNSQVNPSSVEVASKDSKYPLNINKIMDIAIERNASDIQVSVGYPVMIRIDGTLVEVNEHVVSPANAEELIMPVLTDQKKELLEVNREVDLAYSPLHNSEARFRINAYYAKGNLTAAFRLIPSKIRTIEELMLPPMYNQLIKLSQGLVLVTGPTGHGKSTTLAAMLQAINTSRAVHMLTIEDPIEYVFKPSKAVIDQREMHDDTHSWTVALKSALRQDPDVILVGEMRDYETIASTVTLAETGHLVFATLHTNSAAQTVDRIIDVFPENQQAQIRTQLANILEAVVAQRLIPIDGGGRRAVSEIMLGNPAVRNLIREGKTHQIDNVIRTSADVGMVSLEQSLVKLVREGLITMERAQEYAVHPEEVVRLLKS